MTRLGVSAQQLLPAFAIRVGGWKVGVRGGSDRRDEEAECGRDGDEEGQSDAATEQEVR